MAGQKRQRLLAFFGPNRPGLAACNTYGLLYGVYSVHRETGYPKAARAAQRRTRREADMDKAS